MKKNPFAKNSTKWGGRNGTPLHAMAGTYRDSSGRVRRSDKPSIAANGEFNAGSKEELIAAINGLMHQMQNQEIVPQNGMDREQAEERAALFAEALADRTGQSFTLMGEELSDLTYDHVRRSGFLRRILSESELIPGTPPRIRNRKNYVKAAIMGQANFQPFIATTQEQYVYPPEYYVTANVLVEDKEIGQVSGDLLTEKLEDAQESIEVQEDTVLKRLLDLAVQSSGNQVYFSSFTPAFFSNLRSFLQNRGIPAASALVASDLWDDIISNDTFSNWFDPVSKHELVLTGQLGSILNVTIYTDAFVQHDMRVLSPGEVYFLGMPNLLGKHFVRQPLKSEPINQYMIGRPARGWYLSAIYATAIANIFGVSRGRKI